jgi:hypothetical protein
VGTISAIAGRIWVEVDTEVTAGRVLVVIEVDTDTDVIEIVEAAGTDVMVTAGRVTNWVLAGNICVETDTKVDVKESVCVTAGKT